MDFNCQNKTTNSFFIIISGVMELEVSSLTMRNETGVRRLPMKPCTSESEVNGRKSAYNRSSAKKIQ